eukprot:3784296-Rhodomonas_salina.1
MKLGRLPGQKASLEHAKKRQSAATPVTCMTVIMPSLLLLLAQTGCRARLSKLSTCSFQDATSLSFSSPIPMPRSLSFSLPRSLLQVTRFQGREEAQPPFLGTWDANWGSPNSENLRRFTNSGEAGRRRCESDKGREKERKTENQRENQRERIRRRGSGQDKLARSRHRPFAAVSKMCLMVLAMHCNAAFPVRGCTIHEVSTRRHSAGGSDSEGAGLWEP